MQPFPSPSGPERRGHLTLIATLAAGFLVASTIAVVEFVQLRAANERIEELEARDGGEEGGGLFGDLEDVFDDVLGETGGLSEGTGELGSLLECVGSPFSGTGDAGTSVEAIAAQVQGIRELRFTDEVEPTFLGDQEMTDRVREQFLEEYTPRIADLEERLLATLGAIPPGTDLRQLRADTIGGQVAGFYDTETEELVVRQAGSEVSVLDRITLAHELTHALTDQALGIPLPEKVELGREDADLAALAVVEGDASFVMQRYAVTLGFEEQFELLDPEAIARAEAGLEGVPPYLEQELLFAYEEGLNFVCDLYADGGWDAVNAAYAEPPTSTAQVLFPETYGSGRTPVDPRDLPGPGKGWKLEGRFQLGAANLLWLFSAPGGDETKALSDPMGSVKAWTGGEIHLWSRGSETALGMVVTHEERKNGVESPLCGAISEWYARAFSDAEMGAAVGTTTFDGPQQDAALTCGDLGEIRVGIGPTHPALETAFRALAR